MCGKNGEGPTKFVNESTQKKRTGEATEGKTEGKRATKGNLHSIQEFSK